MSARFEWTTTSAAWTEEGRNNWGDWREPEVPEPPYPLPGEDGWEVVAMAAARGRRFWTWRRSRP